jgi:hypothetical protein
VHHYQYAEVVPLLPALPAAGEGLAALFPLLLWGIALALLVIWRHTVGALFEHLADSLDRVSVPTPFGHVRPVGFVAAGLRAADYAVQQALSVSAGAAERAAVYLFHKSVATFEHVGRELYRLAEATGWALQHVILHTIPHAIARHVAGIVHRLGQTIHTLHVVEHALLRPLISRVHRAEAWAEREIGFAHRDVARVRSRVGRLEHDLEGEAARVKRLAALVTLAGFSAFMWRWLGKYELRWLRCPSFARIGRQIGCGGFGLLEDLLTLSFTALALSDICTFAGSLTRLAEWYQPLLMQVVDVEDQMLKCKGGYSKPDPLGLPRLYLPPVPNPLPLG